MCNHHHKQTNQLLLHFGNWEAMQATKQSTRMPAGGLVCDCGFACCASFCTLDAAAALCSAFSAGNDSKLPILHEVSCRDQLSATCTLNTYGGYTPA